MAVALTAGTLSSGSLVTAKIEPPTMLVLAPKIVPPVAAEVIIPDVPQ